MMRTCICLALTVSLLCLLSCEKIPDPELSIDQTEHSISGDGGSFRVNVIANMTLSVIKTIINRIFTHTKVQTYMHFRVLLFTFSAVVCLMFAGYGSASAQNTTKIGIYGGATLVSQSGDSIDDMIDAGYELEPAFGPRVGLDLRIPVLKFLYIKPGVYGEFIRGGWKKESISSIDRDFLNTKTYKYYTAHLDVIDGKYNTSDDLYVTVPLSIGFSIPIGEKFTISLGALGYGQYHLLNRSISSEKYEYSLKPDPQGLSKKTSSESDPVNNIEGLDFESLLSYGIGGEAELRFGAIFTRYRFAMDLKNKDIVNTYVHNISLGFYF